MNIKITGAYIFFFSLFFTVVYFNILLLVCVSGSFDRVHLHDQCLLFPSHQCWLFAFVSSFYHLLRSLFAPLLLVIYLLFVLPSFSPFNRRSIPHTNSSQRVEPEEVLSDENEIISLENTFLVCESFDG